MLLKIFFRKYTSLPPYLKIIAQNFDHKIRLRLRVHKIHFIFYFRVDFWKQFLMMVVHKYNNNDNNGYLGVHVWKTFASALGNAHRILLINSMIQCAL